MLPWLLIGLTNGSAPAPLPVEALEATVYLTRAIAWDATIARDLTQTVILTREVSDDEETIT